MTPHTFGTLGNRKHVVDGAPSATADTQSVNRDPQALRRYLEEDGRAPNRASKTHCLSPSHDDTTPSLHVYDDANGGHAHCYACGWHCDAYTYLVQVRLLSPRAALAALQPGGVRSSQRTARPQQAPKPNVRTCPTEGLPQRVAVAHEARVGRNNRVPASLQGRGFTLEDLTTLSIAQENEAAIIPIYGPEGQLLRLKRRRGPGDGGPRYKYVDADGEGTPAWCSLDFGNSAIVLVIEGELNGMAAWLARPDLDVVGVAGTSGSLPLPALAGRSIVVYTDGDKAGKDAAKRWTQALAQLGGRVSILPTWSEGDACDIAGQHGRPELRARLT